jgi:hypothetical protein
VKLEELMVQNASGTGRVVYGSAPDLPADTPLTLKVGDEVIIESSVGAIDG